MGDRIRETMDGTLGHFWAELGDVYDLNKSHDGHVRLVDNELFHVGTLRTREFRGEFGRNRDRLPRPEAVYGLTSDTRAMFFDIAGVGQSNVMGERASTQTIRTRGVVVDVPFPLLLDSNFTEVEIWIPEVTQWSGLYGVTERVTQYDDERPKEYTASTVNIDTLEIGIRRGLTLTLDTTWSVDGPDDKRVLSTPLVAGTRSDTPRSWRQHLPALIAVQDLINLAYEGFVPAEHATVEFKRKEDGQPRSTPRMWNSRLMTVPPGLSKPRMTQVPLFHLQTIGGVRGVRNWIRLDHSYPRATGPITNRYRYGRTSVEVRLIEVALGLEYWTKVNRGLGRAWAAPRKIRKKIDEPLPMAIGRYVGPAWTEFIGDLYKWSDKFWTTYNSLKHAPNFEYDPHEVGLLGDSGALLLLGALLNRVAGNRIPMKAICQSHRTHMIGYDIRKLLN
ncbi:MAG: hypothetical protein PGN27_08795 [Mycolicibacterium neoaurum]|uniref:ApeA N-terminal domain 1-containing protein n=1 Tax=Mycolicibacterium neoaurum TaxID=1795 RepID=UPI002FF829F0